MSIIRPLVKNAMQSAKEESNLNIPSQPIPAQKTANMSEPYTEETSKKILYHFSDFFTKSYLHRIKFYRRNIENHGI